MLAQSNPTEVSVARECGTPLRRNVDETSMAIADVAEYAHLSDAVSEALGREQMRRRARLGGKSLP
jgi:hypothetical protein